jgi:hypothetical protein
MTQEWRLSHLEPEEEEEFVCGAERVRLAKVRWSEEGGRLSSVQFEMSDGTTSPSISTTADHEFTVTGEVGEIQIGVTSDLTRAETYVSRLRLVGRDGIV